MAKLTSKRQVTIPQAICAKLALEPGDTVQIFERDGVAHLVKMTDTTLAGSLVCSDDRSDDIATTFEEADTKHSIKSRAAQKFKDQE